jgi:signal transduction histidine kinase
MFGSLLWLIVRPVVTEYVDDVIARLLRSRGDLVLAGTLTVAAQAELWLVDLERLRPLLIPLGLVATLALAWRRRHPVVVLGLMVATWIAIEAANASPEDPLALVIALAVAIYSAGAHAGGRAAIAGGLLVAVMVTLGTAQDWDRENFFDLLGNLVFFTVALGGAWAAGVAMRRRRLRERQLVTRTVELEREREEKARAAVAEERARIARELHDVVAHAISVVVLQARGGRHSLDDEPEETREALRSIESTATQALGEMRRLLGILRQDDDQLALAPQPSLAHLDALVDQVRAAGLPVELRVEGEPAELPPGVDLSAYRIVQEALTNALKHAGPARARVVVRYGDEELELEVADDGSGVGNTDGAGHGLIGMRERVAVYGGELDARSRPEGGYQVRACLPLGPARG